ncbi:MAG TPA: bacteriohemerythrin [Bryobacteraceae bacterium]|nr:bacteriohemerythrin [Bryobacteraceae bacterium]
MRKVQWNTSHAVHVPEVDNEHQALFRLCNELQSVLGSGARARQINSTLNELSDHMADHLGHEEREMRASGYSLYAWHRRQHRALQARCAPLEKCVRNGDRAGALESLESLCRLLDEHIRLADRMLGAHLRNHQRELAARGV